MVAHHRRTISVSVASCFAEWRVGNEFWVQNVCNNHIICASVTSVNTRYEAV